MKTNINKYIIIIITFFSILLIHEKLSAQNPGSLYCGSYTVSSPITLNGVSDRTISGLEISNPKGNCITLINCKNITIKQCKLTNSRGIGVEIEFCDNVTIEDCRVESVSGAFYALASTKVKILHNSVKNMLGKSDSRGQMVQFDDVYGSGNRINYNVCENILGESDAEDAVSLFKSSGTSSDPIQVIGNWIRGGGPSDSGGGIMTGDNGGGFIKVENNILVDPGQYGLAIAGGTNIQLINNKVYAKKQSFSNIGLYVWNQEAPSCGDHTVSGNKINWTNSSGQSNDSWNANNCGTISGWNTNIWGADIGANILPEQILGCVTTTTTTIDRQIACDSYTWIDGETYTSSNNTATYTLIDANGHDSVVLLDLTINNSVTGTDVVTTCGSYTWIDGKTYTSSNSTATYTLSNQNGCDSVVTLDLTISNSVTGTDVVTTCGSYTWIDGETYTSSNSTATYRLSNQNGCDSVVTLDLTISNSVTGIDVVTTCGSYTWIDGKTYTSNNNTATFTLTNKNGCDSVVTLDLIITECSDDSVININLGEPSNLNNWNDFEQNETVLQNIKYSNGVSSEYDFIIWKDWYPSSRGDVSGNCFPEEVIKNNVYTLDNKIRYFTLKNLDSEKVYDIEILSSRGGYIKTGESGAVFFVNELADSINANDNSCELVSFRNIEPQNNEIRIGYRKRIIDISGNVNAIIITEKKFSQGETLPDNDTTKSGGMSNNLPIIALDYVESVHSGTVNVLDATKSFDPDNDKLFYKWIVPEDVSLSSTNEATISYLVPEVSYPTYKTFILEVSDGVGKSYKSFDITFTPFKPLISSLQVVSVKASYFEGTNHPVNILDNDPNTYWSAKGDNNWLSMELNAPADISHLKLAFYGMDEKHTLFDIYLSQDNATWVPLYKEFESCGFSSDMHLVECSDYTKSSTAYKYIKIIGHGNDLDDENTISEFKVYGDLTSTTSILDEKQRLLKVYPNPATQFFTVEMIEDGILSLYNISGTNVMQKEMKKGEHIIPIDFPSGCYMISVQTDNNNIFNQKLIVK